MPGELDQPVQVGYLAHRTPRADTAQEQGLGPVNCSDSGEVALVEQRLADGAIRLGPEPADRLVGVKLRAEQVRAEVTDGGVLAAGADDLDDAE